MNKVEALNHIKEIWNDNEISLGEKIISISTDFHSAGLDLAATAAYIKATPAELDSLLSLGELDDEIIERISEINPPKTTWTMLASAGDDEIKCALETIEQRIEKSGEADELTLSELLYQSMISVSGPSIEQKVRTLTGDILDHALKKGKSFKILTSKEESFMKSIASQKRRGKVLSDSQISWLIDILNKMADKGAVTRDSMDGDKKICNLILDAIEK